MMSRNKATWKIKQQLTKINNKYRVMQLQNYIVVLHNMFKTHYFILRLAYLNLCEKKLFHI